ncbi:MAG: helix-turn-helix domain-containing protein, partial [Candidatus Fimousia sp.]
MLKSYKTEINPTQEQIRKINKTIGTCRFPRFKKKNKSDVKMYFVKNNPKDCFCERHRINIPTLGWVRLKEKGYIPTTKQGYV